MNPVCMSIAPKLYCMKIRFSKAVCSVAVRPLCHTITCSSEQLGVRGGRRHACARRAAAASREPTWFFWCAVWFLN